MHKYNRILKQQSGKTSFANYQNLQQYIHRLNKKNYTTMKNAYKTYTAHNVIYTKSKDMISLYLNPNTTATQIYKVLTTTNPTTIEIDIKQK